MKRAISLFLIICLLLSLAIMPIKAVEESLPLPTVQKEAVLSALYEADISTIREALDLRLITCTELTQYYLKRIEDYNEPYNCFITICDDALAVANQRDLAIEEGNADGLLFGIPVVIKDNMDLTGYHTTNGFAKSKDQIADSNADVVEYLLSEGAVIIAKANMSTEAQDALRSSSRAVGETKNAYSIYMAAGGSSGGSAVSTSLNFTVASLGTDTNSSLRIPAALAGCVSLRPTFGLISVKGIKKLNGTRDVPGAITRTVYDQAILLDVLTQGSYDFVGNLDANALDGMRIGVLEQLSYATTKTGLRSDANIDDEVAAAFDNAVAELRSCGAEVITFSMPKLFSLSDATFSSHALSKKEALYEAFEQLLTEQDISAVVYPTYLSTPIRSGKDANGKYWDAYSQTNINNCRTLAPSAGIPEISVPIGTHSLGAGIGMEIATRKGGEQQLLDIAYSYTNAYDHRSIPDGAPNAYSEYNLGSLRELIDGYLQELEAFMNPTEQPTEEIADGHEERLPAQSQVKKGGILQYWPFMLLAVLVGVLIVSLRVLNKRRRKRRNARRRTFQKTR